MQLLDDHLWKLVESGLIDATDAAKVAVEPSRFQNLEPSDMTIQSGV